jgi:hypothetical protein
VSRAEVAVAGPDVAHVILAGRRRGRVRRRRMLKVPKVSVIGRAGVLVPVRMLSLARAEPGGGVAIIAASEADPEEGVAAFGLEYEGDVETERCLPPVRARVARSDEARRDEGTAHDGSVYVG